MDEGIKIFRQSYSEQMLRQRLELLVYVDNFLLTSTAIDYRNNELSFWTIQNISISLYWLTKNSILEKFWLKHVITRLFLIVKRRQKWFIIWKEICKEY